MEEKMNKRSFPLWFLLLPLLCTQCSATKSLFGLSPPNPPLYSVVSEYRSAIDYAQMRILLKEFVQYKEMQCICFPIYQIKNIQINATTQIENSSSINGNATISFPPKLSTGGNITVTNNDQNGVLINIEPVASQGYKAIEQVFKKHKEKVYSLFFIKYLKSQKPKHEIKDKNGKKYNLEDLKKICEKSMCINVSLIERQAIASLENPKALRSIEKELLNIDSR